MHIVFRTDEHATMPLSSCFLATGRSCLAHMIERYSPDLVIMPFMVPAGLIDPFVRFQVPVTHYRLNADLSPNINDVLHRISNRAPSRPLIVVIHYFGLLMPTRECAVIAHEFGGLLLEDSAHCLTSPDKDRETCGDLSLYSLNKILPVPDGAMMFSKSPDCHIDLKVNNLPTMTPMALNAYRQHLAACRIMAMSDKADEWFKMAESHAEKYYATYYEHISSDLTPCRPSEQAVRIAHEVDFSGIVKARREAASHIARHLAPEQKIGLGLPIMVFPIISRDRDALSDKLLEQGIQSNIINDHWREPPVEDFCASYFWKNHLLLPLNEHMDTREAIKIGTAANEGGGCDTGEGGESTPAGEEPKSL